MTDSHGTGAAGAWRWNDPAQEAERQARHEVLIDLLGAYVDGELPSESASQLDAHLVGCARCRREVQLQLSLRAHLATVPVEPAHPALRGRILTALAKARSDDPTVPMGIAPIDGPAATTAGTVTLPSLGRRVWISVVVVLLLAVVGGLAVWRTSDRRAGAVAIDSLGAPAPSVPLFAAVLVDYRSVAGADLPGPARDLAAVRAATGLAVEPIANPALHLLGAWTTTIDGEAAAVLAYRWGDRTIVQYIVPDQLFFRHPALRAAAAAHHAVTGNDGPVGVVAWPVATAGAVLVGDGSAERLAGALVR
jgi:anti-sigma factor RsiW